MTNQSPVTPQFPPSHTILVQYPIKSPDSLLGDSAVSLNFVHFFPIQYDDHKLDDW